MQEASTIASSDAGLRFRRDIALASACERVRSTRRKLVPADRDARREPALRVTSVAAPLDLDRRRALAEAWTLARRHWPRIELDREHFFRHCDGVLGDAPTPAWAPHGVELYLCCACATGDAAALQALNVQYFVRLERQLSESSADAELVAETVQALRIKLLVGADAKIGRFAARGPLSHWLRAAAKRTLLDVIRARKVQRQADRAAPSDVSCHDPDLVAAIGQARYAEAFLDGLRHSIAALDTSDRLLLEQAIVHGSTIDVLGGLYSIHRSTASRRLQRLRREIALAVRRRLKAIHGLSDDDVDELARELCDRLQPSLRGLLHSGAPSNAPRSSDAQP